MDAGHYGIAWPGAGNVEQKSRLSMRPQHGQTAKAQEYRE